MLQLIKFLIIILTIASHDKQQFLITAAAL